MYDDDALDQDLADLALWRARGAEVLTLLEADRAAHAAELEDLRTDRATCLEQLEELVGPVPLGASVCSQLARVRLDLWGRLQRAIRAEEERDAARATDVAHQIRETRVRGVLLEALAGRAADGTTLTTEALAVAAQIALTELQRELATTTARADQLTGERDQAIGQAIEAHEKIEDLEVTVVQLRADVADAEQRLRAAGEALRDQLKCVSAALPVNRFGTPFTGDLGLFVQRVVAAALAERDDAHAEAAAATRRELDDLRSHHAAAVARADQLAEELRAATREREDLRAAASVAGDDAELLEDLEAERARLVAELRELDHDEIISLLDDARIVLERWAETASGRVKLHTDPRVVRIVWVDPLGHELAELTRSSRGLAPSRAWAGPERRPVHLLGSVVEDVLLVEDALRAAGFALRLGVTP